MPSWQADWTDVPFDHEAAEAAAQELEATAQVLNDSAAPLHRSADVARAQWRGPYRERFDEEVARLARERETLVITLLGDARRIRQSSAQARLEQRHREDMREQWRRESEREQAAERDRLAADRAAAERAAAERAAADPAAA